MDKCDFCDKEAIKTSSFGGNPDEPKACDECLERLKKLGYVRN